MNAAIKRLNQPVAVEGEGMSDYSRDTLRMMREASREVYGDHWRDSFEEITEDYHDDDDESGPDPLTLDGGDMIAEAKGFRSSRLTCELVEGFED